MNTFVLHNARIHTLGPAGEAAALAVRSARVVATGSLGDAWSAVGSDAPAVDLGGRTVLPGLIDAHVHWGKVALARRRVVLTPDMDIGAVLARVRAAAGERPRGAWIIGRGWDHSTWGGWPRAADLDAAAPDHPVCLTRKDGHAVWLNAAALAAAGVGAGTPDPAGGAIRRAGDGSPTGVLLENAIDLAAAAVPHPDGAERRAALVESWADAWRFGLVGCHDMGFHEMELWDDLTDLRAEGKLGLRVVWYVLHDALDESLRRGMHSGYGDAWLAVGGLKLFLDGTLGSQTADMLEPYEGQPENRGIATLDFEVFCDLAVRAADAGLATAVHAIGDGANRKALDGFALVRRTRPGRADLRHRIEHAQVVHPADFERFAALGVVASMQPIHATADMAVADRYWGARAAHAYAWRTMLDRGARLAFGTDAPIEPLDAPANLHAAVTRQDAHGTPAGGWHAEQRVSVREAIAAYTLGAAWAGGQDRDLGSLDVGKRADLIVVDPDPFAVPAADLAATRVLATMIDGAWVWQAPDVAVGGPRRVIAP